MTAPARYDIAKLLPYIYTLRRPDTASDLLRITVSVEA